MLVSVPKIYVLLVEDSEDDALLLIRELNKSGFNTVYERVDRRDALLNRLTNPKWDIVITDHNLPNLDSIEVINLVKQARKDIPLIIVSGSIGEDVAVEAMRAGANDYIMKGNLARLTPAVLRELREAESRRARFRAEATIHHMAYHDSLTGLVNRVEFERRLQQCIDRNVIEKASHALFYIDLDQFKIVNDTCGHIAGDELLKQITTILKRDTREHDVVARLGGDEFGILLENCRRDYAVEIAEKIKERISDYRFTWGGKSFAVGASIGIVLIEDAGHTVHELLSRVDMACYTAKDLGRNRLHFYTEQDQEVAKRHGEMQWISRLNSALDENRFALYCQKIITLSNPSSLVVREILVRLHEDGNVIPPGAFIPAAERYNLIHSIDKWVIQTLFTAIDEEFADNRPALNNQLFFVNISGSSLSYDGFFSFISRKAKQFNIPPPCICFEVTETAAITQLSKTVEFINLVRNEGFLFALDDFGAGLSSFSYLKTIPVDFLKIDGSFVRDMVADRLDRAIVEAVNEIGHIIGTRTVAEWVGDQATLDLLKTLNVDFAQGFYIEQPCPMLSIVQDEKTIAP